MFAVWARLRPNLARTTTRGLKWALERLKILKKRKLNIITLEVNEKVAQKNEGPWTRSTHFSLSFFVNDEWN